MTLSINSAIVFKCSLGFSVAIYKRNTLLAKVGKSTGPRSFSGTLGSLLSKCETMPIASYEPIPCDFPVVTADDLSSDQQYLLDICHAVITGECSVSLSHRQAGQLVMSRWLTLANRVLR